MVFICLRRGCRHEENVCDPAYWVCPLGGGQSIATWGSFWALINYKSFIGDAKTRSCADSLGIKLFGFRDKLFLVGHVIIFRHTVVNDGKSISTNIVRKRSAPTWRISLKLMVILPQLIYQMPPVAWCWKPRLLVCFYNYWPPRVIQLNFATCAIFRLFIFVRGTFASADAFWTYLHIHASANKFIHVILPMWLVWTTPVFFGEFHYGAAKILPWTWVITSADLGAYSVSKLGIQILDVLSLLVWFGLSFGVDGSFGSIILWSRNIAIF